MHTNSPPPIDPETDLQIDAQIDPRLRELLQRIEPGPPLSEAMLQDLAARSSATQGALKARLVDSGTGRVRRGVPMSRSWIGISAALLCVIGVMTISMYRSGSEASTTRYQTAAGQVSAVALPDGTVMTLAPATSVEVSRTTVDVVGEAYFAVAQSSTHPLVVRTRNTVVHVLGTAFSVRRYANETRTRVVVEDGKVAVRTQQRGNMSNAPTVMTAHMMAQVSDSGVSVTPVSDTRTLTGWRDGLLVFIDAPVRDVVAEIARCYNVPIRIDGNDLANERMGLEVAIRRYSVSEVLNMVGVVTNAHVRRDGDTYVLMPGRKVATPKDRQQQSFPQPEKLYGR